MFFALNTDTDFWYTVAVDLALCVCQAFMCKVGFMPNTCICPFCCYETKCHSVNGGKCAGVSGGIEANCNVNLFQPL